MTMGEAPRTIALIRDQLRAQSATMMKKTMNHAMNNMVSTYCLIVPTRDGFTAEGVETTNGCAISFATMTTDGEATIGGPDRHLTALPRLIRSEKGTRNFTEAVNQTQ
jgi:hypothetical protein